MNRYFIITVDTEPDGQWDISAPETTENAKFIDRFQQLCNSYGFKPVYLTDYAMLSDSYFVGIMKEYSSCGCCEIGAHLHAWDTPPMTTLDYKKGNRPYLIEYPYYFMEEKIRSLSYRLRETFNTSITSHRAGRWAMNSDYARLLQKNGYTLDCSVTPHIDWSNVPGRSKNSKGSDYTNYSDLPHLLLGTEVLEIPMTVKKINRIDTLMSNCSSVRSIVKSLIKGGTYWFRPALFNMKQMKVLYNKTKDCEYIEMMIHSSELMPGGSPYFPDAKSIDGLYNKLKNLFDLVTKTHQGITLQDYEVIIRGRMSNESKTFNR